MNLDTERKAIEAVMEAVRRGLHDKDLALIGEQFSTDARIFDLAPPLGHLIDLPNLAAWLDTWDGPVDQESRDLTVSLAENLAFCHGYCKISVRTKTDHQLVEWWQRVTVCLRKIDGAWKIVHEHTSVPFYMDGSFLAATDLEPPTP